MSSGVLDISFLTNMIGDDKDILREFLKVFIEQTEEGFVKLEPLCIDGECKPWSEICHQMKGCSAQTGAVLLADYFKTGQNMLTSTAADRTALLAQMRAEYALVKEKALAM